MASPPDIGPHRPTERVFSYFTNLLNDMIPSFETPEKTVFSVTQEARSLDGEVYYGAKLYLRPYYAWGRINPYKYGFLLEILSEPHYNKNAAKSRVYINFSSLVDDSTTQIKLQSRTNESGGVYSKYYLIERDTFATEPELKATIQQVINTFIKQCYNLHLNYPALQRTPWNAIFHLATITEKIIQNKHLLNQSL